MNDILFGYNIVLTIFFTIALTGFYVIYMKNRNRGFLFLSLLYLLLIIDNSMIYMSEFSSSFESLYGTSNIIYIIIYMVYFAIILTTRLIISELFNDKFSVREKQLCVALPIVLAIIVILAPYEIGEGLIYISFFIALCYISLRTYKNINSNPNRFNEKISKRYRILAVAIITLSILAIIDSSLYYIDSYMNPSTNPLQTPMAVALEYRNIPFDIIKLLICVLGIKNLYSSFEGLFDKKSIDEKLNEFCITYSLTTRQKEIIGLVIDGYSNKEISNTLHITEGTVKTHIYNIFKKADISNRNQIMKKIMND
ncbi:helix-turn-helix transcriptional regulator [Wukongibacter baidiensis]|uniref:response regulator transcription factor n=1 Tax=Wukongibacter baidiensis TaxID=1723361 RepID=UPI003D7FE5AD